MISDYKSPVLAVEDASFGMFRHASRIKVKPGVEGYNISDHVELSGETEFSSMFSLISLKTLEEISIVPLEKRFGIELDDKPELKPLFASLDPDYVEMVIKTMNLKYINSQAFKAAVERRADLYVVEILEKQERVLNGEFKGSLSDILLGTATLQEGTILMSVLYPYMKSFRRKG